MKNHLTPKGTMIWSTTTPVPPSYRARKNSDVLRVCCKTRMPFLSFVSALRSTSHVQINKQMATLFGPNGTHPEVVLSDMYGAVVRRCNNDPISAGYPVTKDCPFIQSRGVCVSCNVPVLSRVL